MLFMKRDLSPTARFFGGDWDSERDIYFAAWTGDTRILDEWIGAGKSVTSPDRCGWTVLHLAVWNMHTDVVSRLLASLSLGSRVFTKSIGLPSPLHLATWNNDVDIIKKLLDAGVDSSPQDNDGLTPLHWAARDGNLGSIKVLIDAGADISAQDNEGWRPMHQAVIHDQQGVVDALFAAAHALRPENPVPIQFYPVTSSITSPTATSQHSSTHHAKDKVSKIRFTGDFLLGTS